MPQMAPMNWTLLFSLFVCLYILAMITIYFLQATPDFEREGQSAHQAPQTHFNWKW